MFVRREGRTIQVFAFLIYKYYMKFVSNSLLFTIAILNRNCAEPGAIGVTLNYKIEVVYNFDCYHTHKHYVHLKPVKVIGF